MKAALILALTSMVLLFPARAQTVNGSVSFDLDPTGQVPTNWTVAVTGSGEAVWTVQSDGTAPSQPQVLRQSATLPRSSFALCVQDAPLLTDGIVEVKFRSASGEIDQAGGVVWRYRDRDNYYVCRANALEDNVVLYKVEQGKRTALPIVGRTGGYGVEAKVAPREWHTLRVEFTGKRFTVVFNGKRLFDVEDATFTEAGQVGLWTKADSVTLFDDFRWAQR